MMSMYFRKGIFNDRHGKTTHIRVLYTKRQRYSFSVQKYKQYSSRDRSSWLLPGVGGLEDLGCVAMKSQHKANNTLMIPATHCQLIGGQFIPCWQRLITLRPENHVKNY